MFVPLSLLPQFYAHILAPLSFAGALVLSNAALRDQLDVFFVSATERALAPVALLLAVLLLTHALANRVCGVKHKALWPLFLVPIPLALYELGAVSSPSRSAIVWLLEYVVYLVTCGLLLHALGIGIEHLAKCTQPHEQPVIDEEARAACSTCFDGPALFGVMLLAFNSVLVFGGGMRYSSAPSSPRQLESEISNIGMINVSPANQFRQQALVRAILVGVGTERTNAKNNVAGAVKIVILEIPPAEISSSRWSWLEQVAYAVALSFQSPVSIFAFECIIAHVVYLLLKCLERVFWLLELCGGGGEHSDTLREELNMRNVFSASFSIKYFLFYVFVNHSLLSLSTAERSARLLYLPAWLACYTAMLMALLLDARLRIGAIRSGRCLSPHSLVCAALLLSLAALCCWLVPLTWPAAELPLWHRFWRTLLTQQLVILMHESVLSLASSAALRLFPTRFLQIQTLLECVRVAIFTVLIILELQIYLQSLFAGEWNAVTLVVLFGASMTSIGGVWSLVQKLVSLPKALRTQQLDAEGDADFVALVCASAADEHQQEECPICRDPFTEAAIGEVARTPCRHYFHARCLTAWFLSQPRRSCPLCRQQIDAVSPLDRVRRGGLDANVQNFVERANFQLGIQQGLAAFSAAAQQFRNEIVAASQFPQQLQSPPIFQTAF